MGFKEYITEGMTPEQFKAMIMVLIDNYGGQRETVGMEEQRLLGVGKKHAKNAQKNADKIS